MKKSFWKKSIFWTSLIILGSCIEPYAPPSITSAESFLVVEGFLNADNGPSVFKLSRTQNLADKGMAPAETGALVSLESEQNNRFTLTGGTDGIYTLGALPLRNGEKYRLRIKTSSGSEYLSAYTTIKPNPKIDSVFWDATDEGVQIYVNTHDPNNNTWYYRWEYQETWEYQTPYRGSLYYQGGEVTSILEDLSRCWKTQVSNNIILGTSVRLSQDVIYKQPLIFLPRESPKHHIKYSILVKQYTLDKESFEYWQNLKKNTENIGSLFDAQPSQVTGNIQSVTNSEELVFGYFSSYSVDEKRIFIARNQLPNWRRVTGYESCMPDTALLEDLTKSPSDYRYMFVNEARDPMSGMLIGYVRSSTFCMDCRTSGTNVRPDFWQ